MKNKLHIAHFLRAGLCSVVVIAAATGIVPAVRAQNALNIPFSQFGIGTTDAPLNMPMVARMGGMVYTRSGSNYVNPFNPASYGSIGMESFVFDMGVGLQTSTLRDPSGSVFDADGNVGYLAAAMPLMKRWKIGFGLMPYSTVDYESTYMGFAPTYDDTVKTVYGGAGGINQAFIGMAFNVMEGDDHRPAIQVGANLNWLTGGIDRTISYAFSGNDSTFYINKRRLKHTQLNNLLLDFGLQVRQPLGNHHTLGLGVVYKPYANMKVDEMALIYTYHASDESLVDTIFPARGTDTKYESRFERSHTVGIGISLENNKKWQLGFDATFATWQGMKYTEGMTPSLFGTSILRYGPYSRYALGFERMGNMDANSYWRRISWSLGANYTHGQLRLEKSGQPTCLDQWGAGAGLTFPMRKGRSLLTLSASYTSLGTTDLLRRDVVSFGIAISSCERWFFKRKYD